MPVLLLPASIAPYATRSGAEVVLGNQVPLWLTTTLRNVVAPKPRIKNNYQLRTLLSDILSQNSATWPLGLLTHPNEECRCQQCPGCAPPELLEIKAYVAVVDMVNPAEELHRVTFKLTQETIDGITSHFEAAIPEYSNLLSRDGPTTESNECEARRQFRDHVNTFFFHVPVIVLRQITADGSGMLPQFYSMQALQQIRRLVGHTEVPQHGQMIQCLPPAIFHAPEAYPYITTDVFTSTTSAWQPHYFESTPLSLSVFNYNNSFPLPPLAPTYGFSTNTMADSFLCYDSQHRSYGQQIS